MLNITIKATSNKEIIKFEFEDFITKNKSFEYKNIDETKDSPLAKQLFYLPFVKTIYISGNFIAIEKYSIVEWEDVQDEVAEQIQTYITNGGEIVIIFQENKRLYTPYFIVINNLFITAETKGGGG